MRLTFITAMSYLRSDQYNKAIPLLEEITEQNNSGIQAYIDWSLAVAYQGVNSSLSHKKNLSKLGKI